MKKQLVISLTATLAFALAWNAEAEVKPNALFSDNAVLQQNANVPVWGTAKEGEKVTVTFDGQSESSVSKDGKWMVRLKHHRAGGPFTMTIAGENSITIKNVLVGEVWVCSGQLWGFDGCANATTEKPLANYPKLRSFSVNNAGALSPQAESQKGEWVECSPVTVSGFSDVGYFFGRDIHKATGAPVGVINSSAGGTPIPAWTSLSGLEKDPALHGYVESFRKMAAESEASAARYPQELAAFPAKLKEWEETVDKPYQQALMVWKSENEKNKAAGKPLPPMPKPVTPKPWPPALPGTLTGRPGSIPTTFFNGKIAPIIPYAMKGVIWIPGGNTDKEYRTLFPRLIEDWREKWGEGDFPFLFVPADGPQLPESREETREAHLLLLKKTSNTAMAATHLGDAKQKEPVGTRLALAARALAYGEKIEYSGPEYDSFKIEKNKVILSFKHIGGGLVAKGGPLKGFTVAGAGQPFVPAKAEIKDDTVVVSSFVVTFPVAVRYGWERVPDVNLCSKEGLPASLFRTNPAPTSKPDPIIERFEARTFKGSMELPYRLLKPKDFDPKRKYPLVIYFHGSGERGTNNVAQLGFGVKAFASDEIMLKYPCFVIAPQCPAYPTNPSPTWSATQWEATDQTMPEKPSKPIAAASELLDAIRTEFPIDPTRIYVTGISDGGFGTWDMLQRHPDIFAAGVPVCGGGDKALAPRLAKIPIWIFHGANDAAVKVKLSQDMVAALKVAGGQPKYDEYPGVGHNCWDRAYATEELYDWLFAQRRTQPAPMPGK